MATICKVGLQVVVTLLLLNYVASSVGNSASLNILYVVYISSIQLWYQWYFSTIQEITGEIFSGLW